MIRLIAFILLLLPVLHTSAGAQDLFEDEDTFGRRGSYLEDDTNCSRFSGCQDGKRLSEDQVGDTPELNNSFDRNNGRGSTRSIGDNVLDQLSPASGR